MNNYTCQARQEKVLVLVHREPCVLPCPLIAVGQRPIQWSPWCQTYSELGSISSDTAQGRIQDIASPSCLLMAIHDYQRADGQLMPLVVCTYDSYIHAHHRHNSLSSYRITLSPNAENARIAQACPTPRIHPGHSLLYMLCQCDTSDSVSAVEHVGVSCFDEGPLVSPRPLK